MSAASAEETATGLHEQAFSVLFVDDDRDFLEAQAAYFTALGHTVYTAESSDEALQLLENVTPDVIFLDLMMEHFDSGFQLAYKLRKDPRFAQTPLVMLSGVARGTGQRFDTEGQALLKWTRLDRFVDKPVSARQLLNLARELLAARTGPVDEHPSTPSSDRPTDTEE